jgi:hypothetical protein
MYIDRLLCYFHLHLATYRFTRNLLCTMTHNHQEEHSAEIHDTDSEFLPELQGVSIAFEETMQFTSYKA